MLGPIARMIQSQGREYDVYNADGGGGRSTPSYGDEPDATFTGVLESRGRPQTGTDSDGNEIETDLEIRGVPDAGTTIWPMGSNNGYPTKLEHPNGTEYDVVNKHEEDGGVLVLAVIES